MKVNKTIAAAALAGLFAGATASARAAMSTSSGTPGFGKASVNMLADDKHSCKGQNECKGKGGCKTDDNGCKGKNSCKGKGGCATDGSKKK